MINYNFNQYKISGETATAWTERARKLITSGNMNLSGQQIGEILYMSYVQKVPTTEINKANTQIPFQSIKSIITGKYSPTTYIVFMEMLEAEPEMLDALFITTTERRG